MASPLSPSRRKQQAPVLSRSALKARNALVLEQLVEQLPAAQATALRLTVLEGLSLRAAAERLEISASRRCFFSAISQTIHSGQFHEHPLR